MDFNVGIILYPNVMDHLNNMTEIEDYVQFEATLNYWAWDNVENGYKLNVTELPLVPCSLDKFHEPYSPMRENLKSSIPFARCIENHENVTL